MPLSSKATMITSGRSSTLQQISNLVHTLSKLRSSTRGSSNITWGLPQTTHHVLVHKCSLSPKSPRSLPLLLRSLAAAIAWALHLLQWVPGRPQVMMPSVANITQETLAWRVQLPIPQILAGGFQEALRPPAKT
jgi:hypothetical protein